MDKITYSAQNNMRELIRDNNLLLPVISRFDIAFGFGDAKVADVCRLNDVDTDTFLTVCNFLSGYSFDIERISLPALMQYLKHAHTSFLEVMLPRIRHSLIDAINRADEGEVAVMLIKFFDDYVQEVRKHMDFENDVVFEYVARLIDGRPGQGFGIQQFSVNHGHMASKLKELKDIFIYHYKQKKNDRLSAALFDIINCERDMMSHFDVESRLFVPTVERLERTLASTLDSQLSAPNAQQPSADAGTVQLSQREREIVRCIALGKPSKVIADELCISVNTVATHRRNISAKLEIHSPAGLTLYAIINHLVDINEVTL